MLGCHGSTAGNDDLASGSSTLAAKYPGDVGLKNDPAVVWLEDFEEGSVASVTARYETSNNAGGMKLTPDKPGKSSGSASMSMTSGGANPATDLYKNLAKLAPNSIGFDELYLRWYVKYQANVPWHHTGMWTGGYNPPQDFASPHAGTRPAGNDRFIVAIEPIWGIGVANPRFDYYNYWMNMHTCSSCAGKYWGNSLVSHNSFTADDNQWVCVEMHVRLNTDLASTTGAALEVWRNDALVQAYPETSGTGFWVQDHFCPAGANGADCNFAPFAPGPLDLQMRSTASLQLNAFWPQNYVTDTTIGTVQYDDMVVAKTRIGCIQ
jgi:hypothetical protein